jgi:hypothetical protein
MSFYDSDDEMGGGLNKTASGARAPIQILPFVYAGNAGTARYVLFCATRWHLLE